MLGGQSNYTRAALISALTACRRVFVRNPEFVIVVFPDHIHLLFLLHGNNKGADQPARLHSLISAFVIRYRKEKYQGQILLNVSIFLVGLIMIKSLTTTLTMLHHSENILCCNKSFFFRSRILDNSCIEMKNSSLIAVKKIRKYSLCH